MKYKPYEYQIAAMRWVADKPRCCLFLDMGLGKSVITLTAMRRLIDACEVNRVLVVAPKKVAETTWSAEASKWDHLQSLSVAKVIGTEKQRIAALEAEADISVIGRDSFVWLVKHYKGALPFDTIVIDELTSFKSSKSQRFKAMKIATAGADRVIGLTGTPAPNGLIDLWAQMYCIDRGERLGKSATRYRDTYFDCRVWNNIVVKTWPKKGSEDAIREKLSDICLSMQAKDYIELPSLSIVTEVVELPDKERKLYQAFEREKVLELAATTDGTMITANSAAALMNKLSQFANGAVYDEDGSPKEIHSEKLDRLAEIIEAANGESVLVFYQYRHDIPRIQAKLKGLKVRVYEGATDLDDWNAGEIDVMLAHPSSTAYGLNMQQGGRYIVWFGTGWNLELYQQANARLHRQGQTKPVVAYNLIVRGTVDERAEAALRDKKTVQQALMDSLKYLKSKWAKVDEE